MDNTDSIRLFPHYALLARTTNNTMMSIKTFEVKLYRGNDDASDIKSSSHYVQTKIIMAMMIGCKRILYCNIGFRTDSFTLNLKSWNSRQVFVNAFAVTVCKSS